MDYQSDSISMNTNRYARHSRQKVQARSAMPFAAKPFAGIPGGRHMECAYYFEFCWLCFERVIRFAKLIANLF